MPKGTSNYATWSADPDKNPDAKLLLDGFLVGKPPRWRADDPPTVQRLVDDEPVFAKYNPRNFRNHVKVFAEKAEKILMRRQINGKIMTLA